MEQDRLSREEIVATYRPDVERLVRYLPWLEKTAGQVVTEIYSEQGIAQNSVVFPVYDSTLLQFVREARQTKLVDKNYVYVYSRTRMKTVQDEQKIIARATLQDMTVLGGILSRYVLQGQTRGGVWQQGVASGIFKDVICKMKELIDFWDK